MDEETQHSLECIQANQIFPRKQLIREDEDLQVPFIELHGESTEYVGRAEDAIIALSNYRLHIKFKESVVNLRELKPIKTFLEAITRAARLLHGLLPPTSKGCAASIPGGCSAEALGIQSSSLLCLAEGNATGNLLPL